MNRAHNPGQPLPRDTTLLDVEKRLAEYLQHVPAGMYTENGKHQSGYSVLFRAHLLHALGICATEVSSLVRDLAKNQESDGFLGIAEPVAGHIHDVTYLRLHKSALFFQLADLYDIDVCLPDMDRIFPASRLYAYLNRLDWRNIWLHSNVLLGLATAGNFVECRGGRDPYGRILADFLAAHAPARGLWGAAQGASLLNAMAGTFHLVPILHRAGDPLPAPVELARAVLALQTSRGLFCGPSGYSCIEYDAVYLLWAARPQLPVEMQRAVAEAANGLFDAVAQIQNEDGGFPEMGLPDSLWLGIVETVGSLRKHQDVGTLVWNLKKIARVYLTPERPFLNNSTTACAALPHESNVFSSWLRYLTCCLAADLAGIRPFDRLRACRIVGLNYASQARVEARL